MHIEKKEEEWLLSLSHDETLVFFELIAREVNKVQYEDPAERKIIENMIGLLEKRLAEPFSWDYKKIIDRARERVFSAKKTENEHEIK